MPNPTRQWDQMPVYGWWDIKTGDQLLLTVPDRVRRQDGRMVYPGGKTVTVTVGKAEDQDPAARSEVRAAMRARDEAAAVAAGGTFDGTAWDVEWDAALTKAVFVYFYLTDDPDITPNGWQVRVEEKFAGNVGKIYAIDTLSELLLLDVPGVNLSLQDPPPGSPSAPEPVYAKGQPGGIAGLSVNGFPLTADGVELDPDGLGGGASTVEELTDATPVGKAVVKATTAAVARSSIDAAATTDARFTDQRVPTDGSVTAAKLNAALAASIAKADASLNQAQVDARAQLLIDALVAGSPGLLNTLDELAAALGDDPNFSTTVLAQIAGKADGTATTTALATKGAKTETEGVVIKNEVAGTWGARPTGYLRVRWFGTDPGPTAGVMQANDIREIPVT